MLLARPWAEQSTAPDRLQPTLLRRFGFRRQVSASVRRKGGDAFHINLYDTDDKDGDVMTMRTYVLHLKRISVAKEIPSSSPHESTQGDPPCYALAISPVPKIRPLVPT